MKEGDPELQRAHVLTLPFHGERTCLRIAQAHTHFPRLCRRMPEACAV